MTNKASGTQHTPAAVGLGLILLVAALVLLFRGPGADTDAASGGALGALAAAQTTVTAAIGALDSGTSESYARLDAAAKRLASVNKQGLKPEQSKAIASLNSYVETIRSGQDARAEMAAAAGNLAQLVPVVVDRANALEQAAILQNRPIVTAQLERLRVLVGGIQRDVTNLAAGVGDPSILTQDLLDADMASSQIVRGFQEGDPVLGLRAVSDGEAIAAVEGLADATLQLGVSVRDMLAASDQLVAENTLRGQLLSAANELNPVALIGGGASVGQQTQRNIVAVLVGVAALLFVAIGWISYRTRDFRKATVLQAEQQDRNQKAIMRLLDELGSLADGDLTIKATVTEDITGAIADSINYAIEALRELVVTLNDSAIMVDGAAKQTDTTAQQLAEASKAQSKQIEAASDAIMGMASSIEEISGNAERSSDVARHSVDVAHKGGDAVRRTIEGMNTIRETIQDTAKRIKRLGESSQEIGNIVELINDIADQTNILALNASIQASMAGEAGRGFAVVADEVQRLAERSANATKQIEVLVRTIQSDTNEAVVSMERSTTDVVGGALLAENAGAALEEIEQVSNQIASLVQNISSSAREQSGAAATVTRNMDRLHEINSETEASTSATTVSIRKLAELAAQLRQSVAGFRLPNAELDSGAAAAPVADEIPGRVGDAAARGRSHDQSGEASFVDQKTA